MIRVAGYCRVSTDSEDQANSFESQQRFFREYIERNPRWELFDIYADEGITGTSTKKRIQFNRMIADARQGRFSLIITKEVSRFSRNILDTIAYTRELKALGVGVIFMSDGFSSLEPDAELRLSIMGSIAQEESRKTSARVKWGQTRQMERGVVFGRSMLGYDVQNGKMTVNPAGAEVVKRIFHLYGVEKKSASFIAKELRENGIKTYTGNRYWSDSHILKILKNEKYVGDLVQKKTFTPDYLTHQKKYNHGEEQIIVIRDHHEPIVSRSLWNLVQQEITLRHRNNRSKVGHSNRYVFSGKIICAECGCSFISRIKKRRDGTSYRSWGCINAARNGRKKIDSSGNTIGCDVGKQLRDDLALDMVSAAIRSLPMNIEDLTCDISLLLHSYDSNYESVQLLSNKISRIMRKKEDAIDAYLSGAITKEELLQIKQRYSEQLQILNDRLKTATQVTQSGDLIAAVKDILTCKTISEAYLKALVEYMIVHIDGRVELKFHQYPAVWEFTLLKKTDRG